MGALSIASKSFKEAIDQWQSQVALTQLGQPTDLKTAVEKLPESALERFRTVASARETIKEYILKRDEMLQWLFMAQGGAKYESQAVGLTYMEKAKVAAVAMREQ